MVPACMELTAQRRKHPVPASHSLESVGQKGDPSPSWRRREARTRAAGLIQLLLSTGCAAPVGSLLNTQRLSFGQSGPRIAQGSAVCLGIAKRVTLRPPLEKS